MAEDGEAGRGGRVLADLPPGLWGALLRAVRRAVEDVPRSRLPRALQPFAGWHPEALRFGRARRAVAAALADDPELRERVAARVEPQAAVEDTPELGPVRLAERYGADVAVASLAAAGRWDDVALLATRAIDDSAAGAEVAAEEGRAHEIDAHHRLAEGPSASMVDEQAETRRLREEADRQRRRAEQAEDRAWKAERRTAELEAEIAELRASADRLESEMAAQRRRDRSRISRLKEDLRRAEARPSVDPAAVTEIADELVRLAEELRPGGVQRQGPGQAARQPEESPGVAPEVPREPPAASPGRPCNLPPGLSPSSLAGVRSLLCAPGIHVVLDGYNVSMNAGGRPAAPLEDQRRWVTGVAASTCARFGCRAVVVFDGRGFRPPSGATTRDVLVVFTEEDETADDRIVGFVEALDDEAPVVVVTSDRELSERVSALGGDVVRSDRFLAAVSARASGPGGGA